MQQAVSFSLQLHTSIHAQIHERACEISRRYKFTEGELIEVLAEVENHKVYLHYGHSSLFQYGVHCLSLSANVIYNLIAVMRKSKEVPALHAEIAQGKITLSNAKRIAPVITRNNQDEWLKKASELSQRELEKEIVKIRPKSAVIEKASYVTESRVKLEIGLFEKDMVVLRRVQDLVSKARSSHASLEDAVLEMAQFYLKHKDPVVKAKRVLVKKGFSSSPKASGVSPTKNELDTIQQVSRPVQQSSIGSNKSTDSNKKNNTNQRTPIPAAILHQINLRDQRRCTYTNHTGKKCNQSRWTEIHHIKPVNEGGDNSLTNLTTLCSAHHRWVHMMMPSRDP